MKALFVVIAAAVLLVATIAVAAFGPGDVAETGGSSTRDGKDARAVLRDITGARVGAVKLEQDGDSVKLKISIESGIAPGFHGFHIHSAGVCVAPFTSALGHYNPGAASHRDHAGDLPVLLIDEDGTAQARFSTDRFALDDLFDADGSAFILHASPDNYANIPTDRYDPDPDTTTRATGDAGARAACGVVEQN